MGKLVMGKLSISEWIVIAQKCSGGQGAKAGERLAAAP